MIIFDLDGTLADCEHRRHFVDVRYIPHTEIDGSAFRKYPKYYDAESDTCLVPCDLNWKQDFKSFYEACDLDPPIPSTILLIRSLLGRDYYANDQDVHIWSGRCESVREKTEDWLGKHFISYNDLKMRPVGDFTPDEELKERWLDELIDKNKKKCLLRWCDHTGCCGHIEFVVDARPKVLRMWQRRGIYTFDVGQGKGEF